MKKTLFGKRAALVFVLASVFLFLLVVLGSCDIDMSASEGRPSGPPADLAPPYRPPLIFAVTLPGSRAGDHGSATTLTRAELPPATHQPSTPRPPLDGKPVPLFQHPPGLFGSFLIPERPATDTDLLRPQRVEDMLLPEGSPASWNDVIANMPGGVLVPGGGERIFQITEYHFSRIWDITNSAGANALGLQRSPGISNFAEAGIMRVEDPEDPSITHTLEIGYFRAFRVREATDHVFNLPDLYFEGPDGDILEFRCISDAIRLSDATLNHNDARLAGFVMRGTREAFDAANLVLINRWGDTPTAVAINGGDRTIAMGDNTVRLTAAVTGPTEGLPRWNEDLGESQGVSQGVIWSSSNTAVATIHGLNGIITTVEPGTTTITATSTVAIKVLGNDDAAFDSITLIVE